MSESQTDSAPPNVGDELQEALAEASASTVEFEPSPFLGWALDALEKCPMPPLPDTLYHYTSGDGLLGVVGGDTLRFSDSKFMNDGSEMAWGRHVLRERLRARFSNAAEIQQMFWQTVLNLVENSGETFRHVIFCMSRDGNLLNQWRDYGKDVVPYSIGIDTKYLLSNPPGPFRATVTTLIYNVQDQSNAVDDVISRVSSDMDKHWDEGEQSLSHYAEFATYELNWLVCMFKNPAFEPEQEVRLQLTHYSLIQEHGVKPKFRTSMLGVVPFYEWKPDNGRLAITTIMVGPSPHAHASHAALNMFLEDQMLGEVQTGFSTIPIRR